MLLVGIRQSHKPPDQHHDFGHGKELYFWSLVVAIVLFGVGGGLAFYEGIQHVLDPHPIESPIVSYVVLAVAFVLEASVVDDCHARDPRAGRSGRHACAGAC